MARVFVAMSGGVDSSVAAALLLEQGHDVQGVTMQLHPPPRGAGASASSGATHDAAEDAKRVCRDLGIPHDTVDFRDAFERAVVEPYADSYAKGTTPNPCLECNTRIKFGLLLTWVTGQGGDALATGHYARIAKDPSDPLRARSLLLRARDRTKDQSYFLYRLGAEQLDHVVFPLGEYRKEETRAIAERFGLHVSARPESQDVCFATDGRTALVAERRPDAFAPGELCGLDGQVLGRHTGIANYTIGQRHGLGVGGQGGPMYVVRLDPLRNVVVAGAHDALAVDRVEAGAPIWHRPVPADETVLVQTRYRMRPVPGVARIETGPDQERLVVKLAAPVFGVAPGQAVVCYDEDLVLGGGTIERAR